MDEIQSEDKSLKTEDLIYWVRSLQALVRNMMKRNEELSREVGELKESAAHKRTEMLGCAQVQYYERDERTYRQINAWCLKRYSLSKNSSSVKGTWTISPAIVVWEW
jgi:hypothetical protein